MKIYHNGKLIEQTRNKRGQFSPDWRKIKFTIAVLGMGVFIGGYFSFISQTSNVQASTPQIIDRTPARIAALKADVVTKLMDCERNGYTEEDGLVHIDNNTAGTLRGDDILSYGLLQWKTKTVQLYVKMRDGKDLSAYEAKLLALDKVQAGSLASYAIFEKNGLKEWLNCANKLGLRAQVDAIEFLEK